MKSLDDWIEHEATNMSNPQHEPCPQVHESSKPPPKKPQLGKEKKCGQCYKTDVLKSCSPEHVSTLYMPKNTYSLLIILLLLEDMLVFVQDVET